MNRTLLSFLYATLLCATSTMQALPTPLHYAAKNGLIDDLKMMLSLKCFDVNGKDNKDLTPLHLATQHNHIDCVQELITHGANVNAIETQEGLTPLHTAICINNPQIVQELLNHGADVNAAVMHTIMAQEHGTCGATPLHLAVQTNNVECTRIILARNPNIFMTDCFSQTPLHVAAKNESIDCINLLMEHRNQIKEKIRQYAHASINEEFIEEFIAGETGIDGKDGIGCTPLHYAACEGNQEVADILIKNGANVHAINKRNHTPRDAALVTGQKISVLVQAKAIITPEDVTAVAKRLAFAQYFERYLS